MKRAIRALTLCALSAIGINAEAKVDITASKGWFESAYVTWTNDLSNYGSYNVYYKAAGASTYTQLDKELVRNYGSYGRADVVGIKAGDYVMKVVPVKADGTEDTAESAETGTLTATAYDRTGFAFVSATEGVTSKAGVKFNAADGLGAYKLDGTLKDNARVVYVDANNAKTVTLGVSDGKKDVDYTGIQQIIYGYQKGADARPLCIRIIGTLKDTDCDKFLSSSEGIQIKGANSYTPMNITIEGIGDDATVWGFGFLIRNCCSVEMRNFGIMLCMDDCISMDTDNEHIWIHNIDLFYGNTGGDSDQAKGDGSIDIKGDTKYVTIDHNHLYDCGKTSLCGMKSESGPNYITYHHNWFDHSDSRHPRIRTMSVHVYNNYFDGVSKYGVGVTMGGSAFVEYNYFRNCKYPMLISKQGTDATGKGTFSGENGGIIKSFKNHIKNAHRVVYYSEDNVEFDAYEVASRTEQIPSSVTAKAGGTSYSNFDTDAIMYACTPDAAEDVPDLVTGWLGAGRMGHGDFKWQFDNATQDENYGVITELKAELKAYQSAFVNYYDGTTNPNTGSYTASGGDAETHPDYVPTWGGDDSSDDGNDGTIVTVNKWVFTSWSTESQATLKSEPWVAKDDGTDRYNLTLTSEPASIGLAETDGLNFSGGTMTVSFDAKKGSYIQGSINFYVPVEPGDIVSVVFANTSSSKGTRYLVINDEQVSSSASTTQLTANYTVPEGVTELIIHGDSGSEAASLNYFSISVKQIESTGDDEEPETPTEPTEPEVTTETIKWVFTSWSSESQTTLKAAPWVAKSDGTDRYSLTLTATPASIGLAETDGLTFSGGSSITVSFDSGKGSYIQADVNFHIPVQPGDKLAIVFANTGKSNGERLLMINGEQVSSSSSTTQVTATYTVPEGVTELIMHGEKDGAAAAFNYFSITLTRTTTTEPEEPTTPSEPGDDDSPIRNIEGVTIVGTEYYTLSGAKVAEPMRGFNIVRIIYSDGASTTEKILVK